MPSRLHRLRRAGVLAGLVAMAVGLTGCTGSRAADPTAGPTASPTAGVESSASPSPRATYDSDATADEAHAVFDRALDSLFAKNDNPDGRAVVDALASAGFSKKAMELTPDTTSIGRTVDSIEFSVLWKGDTCLLGQIGTAGRSTSTAPVLSTGECLIGTTRSIDW